MATKKMIFAKPTAATAMPPKPNKAAIKAMINRVTARFNMTKPFFSVQFSLFRFILRVDSLRCSADKEAISKSTTTRFGKRVVLSS
jgi:hypothetical protein